MLMSTAFSLIFRGYKSIQTPSLCTRYCNMSVKYVFKCCKFIKNRKLNPLIYILQNVLHVYKNAFKMNIIVGYKIKIKTILLFLCMLCF